MTQQYHTKSKQSYYVVRSQAMTYKWLQAF